MLETVIRLDDGDCDHGWMMETVIDLMMETAIGWMMVNADPVG